MRGAARRRPADDVVKVLDTTGVIVGGVEPLVFVAKNAKNGVARRNARHVDARGRLLVKSQSRALENALEDDDHELVQGLVIRE
ncbi:hypothetical protein CYMTET_24211, partial [Cymbomonas tetramitiformis]